MKLNRADVRLTEKQDMENDKMAEDAAGRLRTLGERIAADGSDEEALIERGRLYWALGQRGKAISDYLAAQRLNPSGKATQLLAATYEILDFYNKDLYNP